MNNILCFEQPPLDYASKIQSVTVTNENSELTETDIIKGDLSTPPKYATLEPNAWRLDGSYSLIDDEKIEPYAYWSETRSGAYGSFGSNQQPVITIQFTESIEITGMTIITDEGSPITNAFISLTNNNTTVASTYAGTTSAFLQADISGTGNKITITVLSTTRYRRLKIRNIKIGKAMVIGQDMFYDVSLHEEISIPSDTIPMNTLDFTLHADSETIKYIRDNTKCIELYKDLKQFGVFYLDDIEKMSNDKYALSCVDAIGVLDRMPYSDNMFISVQGSSVSIQTVLSSIFDSTNIPYVINGYDGNSAISIKFTGLTRRDALVHLLLCINATCLKQRNGVLAIEQLSREVRVDITNNIFNDYTVTDNMPVASISMEKTVAVKGDDITDGFNSRVVERGKNYVLVEAFSDELLWSPTADIALNFLVSFYDADANIEYAVTSALTSGSSATLPDKISYSNNGVIFRIDTEVITESRNYEGNRPTHYQVSGSSFVNRGTMAGQWSWNGLTIINHLQRADWSTLKIYRIKPYVTTAHGVTLGTSSQISMVVNPNKITALKTTELQIQTVQISSLTIDGTMHLGETETTVQVPVADSDQITTETVITPINTILEYMMENYYQYNKTFEGKVIAEGLHCGDTVQMTLPNYGTVPATITSMDYNLINKEIARINALMYYTEE